MKSRAKPLVTAAQAAAIRRTALQVYRGHMSKNAGLQAVRAMGAAS